MKVSSPQYAFAQLINSRFSMLMNPTEDESVQRRTLRRVGRKLAKPSSLPSHDAAPLEISHKNKQARTQFTSQRPCALLVLLRRGLMMIKRFVNLRIKTNKIPI